MDCAHKPRWVLQQARRTCSLQAALSAAIMLATSANLTFFVSSRVQVELLVHTSTCHLYTMHRRYSSEMSSADAAESHAGLASVSQSSPQLHDPMHC